MCPLEAVGQAWVGQPRPISLADGRIVGAIWPSGRCPRDGRRVDLNARVVAAYEATLAGLQVEIGGIVR
jgi:hypothetical protein